MSSHAGRQLGAGSCMVAFGFLDANATRFPSSLRNASDLGPGRMAPDVSWLAMGWKR